MGTFGTGGGERGAASRYRWDELDRTVASWKRYEGQAGSLRYEGEAGSLCGGRGRGAGDLCAARDRGGLGIERVATVCYRGCGCGLNGGA